MTLLETIREPAQLRDLTGDQLETLAAELREKMIRTVHKTGGHLASSLGAVEMTLALHRVMDSPRDRIVWDTGHQAYAHKLLTGRSDRFDTLRQVGGIGGFPRRSESEHDVFDGGHAGTGVSIGVGLAAARDLRPATDPARRQRIAVCVGDAAMGSGLTLEALNHLGHVKHPLLIVLNDNEMSISPSVGGLSTRLNKLRLSRAYQETKSVTQRALPRIPLIGKPAFDAAGLGQGGLQALVGEGRLLRGHRAHLHRRPRRPRPAGARAGLRGGLPARGAGGRPRQDDQGPRLRAGRGGRDELPRRIAAAHRPAA